MREILKIIKHKTTILFKKILEFIKARKKILIWALILLVLLVLCVVFIVNKKPENVSGNLKNLGFTVGYGKTTYSLVYRDGVPDGIYKIDKNNKVKISDDYGYFLNKSGKYIYYIDAVDGNIIKMQKDGKQREVVVESVDTEIMTVAGGYIYYFDNSYFYRIKINGENKKRISNKSLEMYQIVGKYIYYSYMDDGSYSIARMETNGENSQRIATNLGKSFFVNGKYIYYIYRNINENNYELCKININGEKQEVISKINGYLDEETINFYDNSVYYSKKDEEGNTGI